MDVKNIAEVSKVEAQNFFDSFDNVVLDCDGVLWNDNQIIPGAKECLAVLQSLGKGLKFVANNSVRSRENYEKMFKTIGIDIQDDDLIHPVIAIINHLKSIDFTGLIYCIGSTSFKAAMKEAGFEIIDGPMDLMPESFEYGVDVIREPKPVKAVVVDVDFNNSHHKCGRAAYFLEDPDVLFITGARDSRLPIANNLSILGPGHFTRVIEEVSGRKSLNFSKSSKGFAEQVVARAGNRCLFVGDMLEHDMEFANYCRYKKLLVLSGGTSKEELVDLPLDSHNKPDYYGNSLLDLFLAAQKLNKLSIL